MKKIIHLGFCCMLTSLAQAHAPATVPHEVSTADIRDAKINRILACVGRVVEGLIKIIRDPHNKPAVLLNVGEMLAGVFDATAHALPQSASGQAQMTQEQEQEFRKLVQELTDAVEPMLRQYIMEQARSVKNHLQAVALNELETKMTRSASDIEQDELALLPTENEPAQELHTSILSMLHALVHDLFAIIQNTENPQVVGQNVGDMLGRIMNIASQTLKYEYLASADAEEHVAMYLDSFSNELTQEIKHLMLQTALHLRGGSCCNSSKSCCNSCSKNSCGSSCGSCSSSAVCKPCYRPCNSCCRNIQAPEEEAAEAEQVSTYMPKFLMRPCYSMAGNFPHKKDVQQTTKIVHTGKPLGRVTPLPEPGGQTVRKASCNSCKTCSCKPKCTSSCNSCKQSCCKRSVDAETTRSSCNSCKACSCKPTCTSSCSSCKQSCCKRSLDTQAIDDEATKCGCNKPKPKPKAPVATSMHMDTEATISSNAEDTEVTRSSCNACKACSCKPACTSSCSSCKQSCCKRSIDTEVTRSSCNACKACSCKPACTSSCNSCKQSCCKRSLDTEVTRSSCNSCKACSCKPACTSSCSSCKQSCCKRSLDTEVMSDEATKCACSKPKPKPKAAQERAVQYPENYIIIDEASKCGCNKPKPKPKTAEKSQTKSCCKACGKTSGCGCHKAAPMQTESTMSTAEARRCACSKPKPKPKAAQERAVYYPENYIIVNQ